MSLTLARLDIMLDIGATAIELPREREAIHADIPFAAYSNAFHTIPRLEFHRGAIWLLVLFFENTAYNA